MPARRCRALRSIQTTIVTTATAASRYSAPSTAGLMVDIQEPKRDRGDDTEQHCGAGSRQGRTSEFGPAGLAQEGDGDPDNEGGFDSLAKCDDERIHGDLPAIHVH